MTPLLYAPGWIRTTDPRIRKIGVIGIITLSEWVHTRYCPYVALTYPSQLGVGSPAGTWLGLVTPPPRPLPRPQPPITYTYPPQKNPT